MGIRVLHVGLGPIGAGVVRQVAERKGLTIVGGVDGDGSDEPVAPNASSAGASAITHATATPNGSKDFNRMWLHLQSVLASRTGRPMNQASSIMTPESRLVDEPHR